MNIWYLIQFTSIQSHSHNWLYLSFYLCTKSHFGSPHLHTHPGTLGASCKALLRRLESSKWMACLTYSNRGVFVCGILDIKEENQQIIRLTKSLERQKALATLWFWGFWASKTLPHLVGKYITLTHLDRGHYMTPTQTMHCSLWEIPQNYHTF